MTASSIPAIPTWLPETNLLAVTKIKLFTLEILPRENGILLDMFNEHPGQAIQVTILNNHIVGTRSSFVNLARILNERKAYWFCARLLETVGVNPNDIGL